MIVVRLGGTLTPFEGPLDLLLALVRQDGYPLDQLPVSRITGRFLSIVNQWKAEDGTADPDLLSEFIETGCWLVLLKSRSLLPKSSDEAEPAAAELHRVLVDYAGLRGSIRQTAQLLAARMDASGLTSHSDTLDLASSSDAKSPISPTLHQNPALGSPTMHDAILAARRALEAVQVRAQTEEAERFMVEAASAWARCRIAALPPGQVLSTAAWFGEQTEPQGQAALLLALLELARIKVALIHQPVPYGPILIKAPVGYNGDPDDR